MWKVLMQTLTHRRKIVSQGQKQEFSEWGPDDDMRTMSGPYHSILCFPDTLKKYRLDLSLSNEMIKL